MLSSIFIARPRLAIVISIVITIAGLLAYLKLPISQFPDITPPTVSVSATYPGADAAAVEQAIAQIIEPAVNGVDGMVYMQSTSGSDGSYSLVITFGIGSDPDLNAVNVSNRVNRVLGKLPSEVQNGSVPVSKGSGSLLQVLSVYSPDSSRDAIYLSNYATLNILDEIKRVPGVASADLFGALDYSMRIWLDVNKMASLGITTPDIISAVKSQNVQAAVGRVGAAPLNKTVDFQLNLTANGKLVSPEQFENIIIKSNDDGSLTKVKDIAKVEIGANSEDTYSQYNGKAAAGIGINLLANANAIKTAEQVHKVIDDLKPRLPNGVQIEFMYDTSLFVKKMLGSVKETLIEAFILSGLVVIVFLGSFRSAIIPIIAVPVSLVGTFAIINLLGYSLNTISLLALVLAIGIVVDDAIVVVENVTKFVEENPKVSIAEATNLSMQQITGPILAITFVLLSVFIPTIFIPGISGKLFTQFAVVVCSSMFISAINALTLSPALCAILLQRDQRPIGILGKISGYIEKIRVLYSKLLNPIVDKANYSIVAIILFGLLAVALNWIVPSGFVPSEDQGVIMGEVMLPDAASLTRTRTLLGKVESKLESKPWAQAVFSVSGQSMMESLKLPNRAFFVVLMKPYEDRKDLSMSVKSAIGQLFGEFQNFSDADVIPFNVAAIPGLGTSDGFEFQLQTLTGSSIDEFAAVARGFADAANQDPRLSNVTSNFSASTPQISLTVDRDKAKALGVDPKDIYDTLQADLAGTYINDFIYMGRTWQVKAQAEASARKNIDDIFQIRIKSSKNEMISLQALAEVKMITAPASVTRYNNLRSITLRGTAAKGHSSSEAIAAIEELVSKKLPKNYKIQWTGTALEEKAAASQKATVFLLAIVFSYLFLVALYESWMLPISVIISIIVGLFGAMLAMFLTGVQNNLYAQIGIVVLIALASKNAILIVELAIEKKQHGLSTIMAAKEAASERFRAIMMTSFAFILGVYPLVIATGAGAETQRSVSTAVFGGMIASSMLSVLIVPGLFIVFQNISDKIDEWRARKGF